MKALDIIIPVYNEEKNLNELVNRLSGAMDVANIDFTLIFVDDNSKDATVKILTNLSKEFPIKIHTKKGIQGKGYSIIEGLQLAITEYVAFIDGDLQYPPEVLPEMLKKAYIDNLGVVVANRRTYSSTFVRKAGSRLNKLIFGKFLLGLNCDTQSGLKVFKREIANHMNVEHVTPWTLDVTLLHTAKELGYKIGGVDIDYVLRVNGSSNINFAKTAWALAIAAIKTKLTVRRVFHIAHNDTDSHSTVYKGKHYKTHTNLPHYKSALYTLKRDQKFLISAVIVLFIASLIFYPFKTLIWILAILSAIYFLDVLFNIYLILKSLSHPPEIQPNTDELNSLSDENLPIYTILCPLYKEDAVLKNFVEAISALDWPKDKLEVLLLLEEDDDVTVKAAEKLNLPEYFKTVVVPHSMPKTKPKACNYGLKMASGEYVVIYDAEDMPDSLQLKKAYLAFKNLPEDIICVQAKLNYYNPHHNLLTRMFTAEYTLWFDIILPGLQSIETTIPLGGTSNHFKAQYLKDLHGWDPFNVTEDCDLGARLFKEGYKTAIIDSTTLEEANSNVKNWIRQRSRWLKGYMQTYLVHMRDPLAFLRKQGIHALIFQLIIGLRISFILINPILWLATISYFVFNEYVGETIEALFPSLVFYMAAFSLVFGNFLYIYNYMIGLAKREKYNLIKFVFFVPFYWFLMSIAAVMAFWQLIFKPHHWEKTHHGLHLNITKKSRKLAFISRPTLAFPRVSLPTVKPAISTATIKNLYDTTVSAGLALIAATMVANVLNFLTSAYLGRTLSEEGFGLIALLSSFMFIAQIPAAGVAQTISNNTAFLFGKYNSLRSEIWYTYRNKLTKISLILVAGWIASIPLLSTFFNSHTLVPFIVFAPMWTLLLIQAVNTGFLEGSHKFYALALLVVISAFVKLAFSVVFVQFNMGEWVYTALPISILVSMVVGWVIAARIARSALPRTEQEPEKPENLKLSKKFFTTAVLTKLSAVTFLSLDLIFVKHYLSAIEAGQYALLILVGRMVYMIGSMFAQFIIPIVSKDAGAGSKTSVAFKKILLAIVSSTFVAFIIVGLAGSITIPILFGEKALPILPYLIRFSFAMMFFSVAYAVVTYYHARREYIFAIPGILTVIVQSVGLYVFHANISHVVNVMILSGAFFLVAVAILHTFKEKFIEVSHDILDLLPKYSQPAYAHVDYKADGKLNILILNWRDTKHVWAGGAEVYVHELAKRWVKDGHDVTLFCGNDGKNTRNEQVEGVNVVRRGGFYTVYIWAFFYYIFKFRSKYDIIIDSENGVPFFAPLYTRTPVIGLVHHVHSEIIFKQLKLPITSWPVAFIAKQLESKIMPFVYRNVQMVTVSNSSKSDMERIGFGRNSNIIIMSPGVDLNDLKPGPKTVNPSILYLGRLKPYKSLETLIYATRNLAKTMPYIEVKIAGFGESRKRLEVLVKELNLENNVKFLGRVSDDEKIKLLSSAWVFVQPSTMEGWGISVLEANACGTPVVASRVPGLVDSVKNKYTGITVEVGNSKAFSKAIKKILIDDELRAKYEKNSLSWAENFDWNRISNNFAECIQTYIEIKEAKKAVVQPRFRFNLVKSTE